VAASCRYVRAIVARREGRATKEKASDARGRKSDTTGGSSGRAARRFDASWARRGAKSKFRGLLRQLLWRGGGLHEVERVATKKAEVGMAEPKVGFQKGGNGFERVRKGVGGEG
jgi:hypothetical protein